MRRQSLKSAARFLAVTLALPAVASSAADSLILLTAHSPPLSIVSPVNQTVTGTTTDLLSAALSETGIHFTITAFPWARALTKARSDTDTCVYPAVRTPERERSFKWVGPAETNFWTLFGRRGEVPPASIERVKERTIGGSLGDAATQYLKENGYKVDESRDDELNMRKLQTHRIDYWINNLANGLYLTRQAGLDDIIPVLTFKEMPVFLACNLSVPDRLIADLNKTLLRQAALTGPGAQP